MKTKIMNPILKGFNPDPSILFANGKYYIANSTFEYFPGVCIYESENLAEWKLLCQPLNSKKLLDMRGNDSSCGVWAPCLSFDKGVFYLVYANVRTWAKLPFKDVDNFLITTDDLCGEWSDPIYLNSSGFDASLFHDDDGKKWYLNMEWDYRAKANMDCFSGILLQEYDEKEKTLIGNPKKIFTGTDLKGSEGPHLYKRNGFYYLLTAEGGTSYQHAATIARSEKIDGEYQIHPLKHMLTAYNTECKLQKAGHASMCVNDKSEWILAHLCGRPIDKSLRCVLGRETALQNIEWIDDFPYIVGGGNAPLDFFVADNVNAQKNDKKIVYNFNKDCDLSDFQTLREDLFSSGVIRLDDGGLHIVGKESIYSKHTQALLARRQTSHSFCSVIHMKFNPDNFQQLGGLIYRYNEQNAYFCYVGFSENENKIFVAVMANNNSNCNVEYGKKVWLQNSELWLKLDVVGMSGQFYFSYDGINFSSVGDVVDASILSDEYANPMGFTGAFVGMCCIDMQFKKKEALFYSMNYEET